MPQFFESAVMTNAGKALMARSLAEGITINFTALVVGDGSYTNTEKTIESLEQRTELKNQQVSYVPNSVIRNSENSVRVSGLITNVDPEGQAIVTAGFYINEIGLMAEPSDQETDPILFSVCVTSETRGDYMPAYTGNNPVQIIQGYVTAITNHSVVTLTTPVNPYALAADLQALSDAVDERIGVIDDSVSELSKEVKSLGLTVRNGKLCAIYNR